MMSSFGVMKKKLKCLEEVKQQGVCKTEPTKMIYDQTDELK